MTDQCRCGTPTRDNAHTCDECANNLTRALAETPWLIDQLEITLTKQKGVDYTAADGTKGGTKTRPAPANLGALEAAGQLRAALLTWTRHCHHQQTRNQSPTQGLPVLEPKPMSRWLMWRIDGLTLDPQGPQAVEDITRAVNKARRVVDRAPEQRYAGPCECGKDIYHRPGAVQASCRACGRAYDVGELYEWMRSQVRGRLVTAKEGAMLLSRFGVATKRDTIDKWHQRGRVANRGADTAGRNLYLFDDLLDLATAAA